jgi:hypothetical protein
MCIFQKRKIATRDVGSVRDDQMQITTPVYSILMCWCQYILTRQHISPQSEEPPSSFHLHRTTLACRSCATHIIPDPKPLFPPPPPKPPTKIRYCTSRSRDFHPVTGKPPTRSLRSPALVFGYCETRDKQDPAGERELNLSLNYRRPTIGLATICSRAPAARPNSQTWSGEGESLPCFSNVFRD